MIQKINFPDNNMDLFVNKYNKSKKRREVKFTKIKLNITLLNSILFYIKNFKSKILYIIIIGLISLVIIIKIYLIISTTVVTEVTNTLNLNINGNGHQFTSSNNNSDIFLLLFDSLMQYVGFSFKPAEVSGYLDDLIGQQIAVIFILLFTSLFLILLIIAYIVNNLLFFNKNLIINKLGKNNKFIQFYLKYQVFCIRLSLFYLPVFMFIGFFTLVHGLYFLITHQIPYESLDIDLHVFVRSR